LNLSSETIIAYQLAARRPSVKLAVGKWISRFRESENQRLRRELQATHDASQSPEMPSDKTRAALNELLVRVRMRK
jgi:hypothetical protein